MTRTIKIFLLTLLLLGTQVIQASPLHDHGNHVVNCALCHFDNNDSAVPVNSQPQLDFEPGSRPLANFKAFVSTSIPASYQGRAPPFS